MSLKWHYKLALHRFPIYRVCKIPLMERLMVCRVQHNAEYRTFLYSFKLFVTRRTVLRSISIQQKSMSFLELEKYYMSSITVCRGGRQVTTSVAWNLCVMTDAVARNLCVWPDALCSSERPLTTPVARNLCVRPDALCCGGRQLTTPVTRNLCVWFHVGLNQLFYRCHTRPVLLLKRSGSVFAKFAFQND